MFLENIDWKNRAVKIGLFIGEDELRGCGLGKATLKHIVALGCHDWGLHRLAANCLATNQAMIRCLESVGFLKEGHMREAVIRNGQYQDLLIYSYLSHETG